MPKSPSIAGFKPHARALRASCGRGFIDGKIKRSYCGDHPLDNAESLASPTSSLQLPAAQAITYETFQISLKAAKK